jgi:hypothetical protein
MIKLFQFFWHTLKAFNFWKFNSNKWIDIALIISYSRYWLATLQFMSICSPLWTRIDGREWRRFCDSKNGKPLPFTKYSHRAMWSEVSDSFSLWSSHNTYIHTYIQRDRFVGSNWNWGNSCWIVKVLLKKWKISISFLIFEFQNQKLLFLPPQR